MQSKLGLASFICGLVGALTAFTSGLLLGATGIVAVILGVVSIVLSVKAKKANGAHWMSTVGLIAGIVSIAFGLPGFLCFAICSGATCAAGGAEGFENLIN